MKLTIQIDLPINEPSKAVSLLLAGALERTRKEIITAYERPSGETLQTPIRDAGGNYIGFWQITEGDAS